MQPQGLGMHRTCFMRTLICCRISTDTFESLSRRHSETYSSGAAVLEHICLTLETAPHAARCRTQLLRAPTLVSHGSAHA